MMYKGCDETVRGLHAFTILEERTGSAPFYMVRKMGIDGYADGVCLGVSG